jgi:hypothetical protein
MTATQPSTPQTHQAPALAPTDPALALARWRVLRNGVVFGTVAAAVLLAAAVFLSGKPDWWRGYVAASVATTIAAAASLVPLWIGVRGAPQQLILMVMVSSGARAFFGLGLAALAVGVGNYPAVPTLMLMIPYYLALLGSESVCLAKGLKLKA